MAKKKPTPETAHHGEFGEPEPLSSPPPSPPLAPPVVLGPVETVCKVAGVTFAGNICPCCGTHLVDA